MIITILSFVYILVGLAVGSLVHYFDPFDAHSSDELFIFSLCSIFWPVTLIVWACTLPLFLISLWVSKINQMKRARQKVLDEIRRAKELVEHEKLMKAHEEEERKEREEERKERAEERARAKMNAKRRQARKAKKEAETEKALAVYKTSKSKSKPAKVIVAKKLDSME